VGSSYAGLEKYSLKAKLLPFTLKADKLTSLTEEDKTKVPATMAKYLIHNQSFLTDFKFLGFPFHYFYTAVFLLILFVGLCWIYCYRTDKKMTKFEVVESA
jgi:putative solute:sodium symporter small subunit